MNLLPVVLTESSSSSNSMILIIVYLVVLAGIIYFMSIRPGRTRQKKLDAMLASLEVGDSVLTTSGFYGVVIDITDVVVVVEFGSDRHCRIPMQKTAIVSVEKADENL